MALIDQDWTPSILTSRRPFLPDWSYAGYRWGDEHYPEPIHVIDMSGRVTQGQDVTDALKMALSEAGGLLGQVAIRFPAGVFEISGYIRIECSGVTIIGAGSGANGTTFWMPKPLDELPLSPEIAELAASLAVSGAGKSPFAWTAGFFWSKHPEGRSVETLAKCVTGRRGTDRVYIQGEHSVQAGDTIQLQWFNRGGNDSELLRHVFRMKEIDFGPNLSDPTGPLIVQDVTVVAVRRDRLIIKERLVHDLQPGLGAEVARRPMLSDVGFEGFRIVFPDVPYAGHLRERGYNAIYMEDVRHGWVKDVAVVNADSGFVAAHSSQVTFECISVEGRGGHHGISCTHGNGILVKNFSVLNQMVHPITMGTRSHSCVYTNGWLAKPNLDQHRGVNHQNLFDEIRATQISEGCRLFRHGGASAWGPTAGAFNTFWNINVSFPEVALDEEAIRLEPIRGAADTRIVGLHGNRRFARLRYGPRCHVEGLNRGGIAVPSLYRFQLEARRSKNVAPAGRALS